MVLSIARDGAILFFGLLLVDEHASRPALSAFPEKIPARRFLSLGELLVAPSVPNIEAGPEVVAASPELLAVRLRRFRYGASLGAERVEAGDEVAALAFGPDC